MRAASVAMRLLSQSLPDPLFRLSEAASGALGEAATVGAAALRAEVGAGMPFGVGNIGAATAGVPVFAGTVESATTTVPAMPAVVFATAASGGTTASALLVMPPFAICAG